MKKNNFLRISFFLVWCACSIPVDAAPAPENNDLHYCHSETPHAGSKSDNISNENLLNKSDNELIQKLSDLIDTTPDLRLSLYTNISSMKGNYGIKTLIPLYEKDNLFLYTEEYYNHVDNRIIESLGFGGRQLNSKTVYGANIFFDYDKILHHSRFGLGIIHSKSNFSISSNVYLPVSELRNDKKYSESQSRPARGWDIRTQTWLPVHPRIGASINFEKYHGRHVHIMNDHRHQRNPHLIVAGINYVPVPLFSTELNIRKNRTIGQDITLNLNLNYTFGQSLERQLSFGWQNIFSDTEMYGFTSRNNDLILN